jgi:hypothetical protein
MMSSQDEIGPMWATFFPILKQMGSGLLAPSSEATQAPLSVEKDEECQSMERLE